MKIKLNKMDLRDSYFFRGFCDDNFCSARQVYKILSCGNSFSARHTRLGFARINCTPLKFCRSVNDIGRSFFAKFAICTFVIFVFCVIFAPPIFSEKITFKADSMTGKAGSKSDTTNLIGNAFIKTDSVEISADSIVLSGDDFRYINAQDSVVVDSIEEKLHFTCGNLFYDRETKTITLRENVHLEDGENDVTADSQIIEYNQDTGTAVLQISINLKQKENVCTGSYAIYYKNDKVLELSGSPKIMQNEDVFKAQEITLNLETQEITLDGRIQGTVTTSKTKKSDSEEKKGN